MWGAAVGLRGVLVYVTGTLCGLLSGTATFLAALRETLPALSDLSWTCLLIAGLCVTVSAPLAHGIIGKAVHSNFEFFQPFSGGIIFMILQGVAWTCYGLALAVFVIVTILGLFRIPVMMGAVAFAGIAGAISQGVILLSLSYFEDKLQRDKNTGKKKTSQMFLNASYFAFKSIGQDFLSLLVISLFYCLPAISPMAAIIPPFLIAITRPSFLMVWGMLIWIYARTYKGSPNRTGKRVWKGFRGNKDFFGLVERYFQLRIIPTCELDPRQQYMFGYHPHGEYLVIL
jgi:hypothetical protein